MWIEDEILRKYQRTIKLSFIGLISDITNIAGIQGSMGRAATTQPDTAAASASKRDGTA